MATPEFYQPASVGTRFVPDLDRAVSAGQAAGLSPASDDRQPTLLLLVDAQIDFIHADGALNVPGAVDDTRRTIEWLLRHAGEVTDVAASLDSHVPLQIFYSTWWRNTEGRPPDPFTPITAQQVDDGVWRPIYEAEWSKEYVLRLEAQSKKQLMIWPFHTMLGTSGHALDPSLAEAVAFHSAARQSQPTFIIKGLIPKTEYYSLLEPEVKVPEDPGGKLNQGFLDRLLSYDRVYVAGQAKSHCVLETLASIVRQVGGSPEMLSRLRLLEDCTSSVAHPQIDFEAMALEALEAYEAKGLRRVGASDPLD
jgi:nicotinamidase-related amidase